MASLKYEELKTCMKKGGNAIGTLKLCVEAFSKNDEAFHKAVDHMSFWCPQLFSLAFSECVSTRILAVKCINLFMPKFVDRSKPFSDDWWKQLKQDITKKYAVLLAEKLETYQDWDTLWKLCVSILDIELYQSTTLVNALLKVAEKAFRDKKLVITAFNCWNHFITVYAKSPNVMFSSKQISLLITPLTAKSHYTLKYCEVKLEVWNTLISLVVDKSKQAVDVIIAPLLSFLYGPLKMPEASSFPELVDRSAESYLLVLNNPNVFKYINKNISSYLPKVILSLVKSKKIEEELILRLWKTFFAKVKQIKIASLLDNAVESITAYSNELNEENTLTFMKLIEVFMAEEPTIVCKHLHQWILCENFLSVKLPDDNRSLVVIFKEYEDNISKLDKIIGHLFDVPLNFKRDDSSKWNTCLSNLSELWLIICDTIHLTLERNEKKPIEGLLSSDTLLQLLMFPVDCLHEKWCSRIMKHWRLLCNDSVSILPTSENVAGFGSRLIDNLIVTIEKHPKSLPSVANAALETCGILLSSILLKGNVKQAVPLIMSIVKLIERIESVPSRQNILLNEALPKISLWSNLHVELNTDLISVIEAISFIGMDNSSVNLKNKIAKVSRLIRSNVVQSGNKPLVKETPSTPKSVIKNTSFMHRLDRARSRQSSNEDLKKLLSTPEKPKKDQEEDEYVYIAPKTKVTPLTKHQKEVMKSRRVLPAMYNGLSQDTQSQDSQALDVILSVGGTRPVKKTLDSTNENAIDELLDEFETKDDSIFDRVVNRLEIKQEAEVKESDKEGIGKTTGDSKDVEKSGKDEPELPEKLVNSADKDTQELETKNEDPINAESENESKKEVSSKILSLLKDECKKSDNNLGKFFNVLINEPHPALYLFHKLKEMAENSGDHDLQLIYKEFSLIDLNSLYSVLNATTSIHSESSKINDDKKETSSKGATVSRKSIPKNRKSTNDIKESNGCSGNTISLDNDCCAKSNDEVSSRVENSVEKLETDCVESAMVPTEVKEVDVPSSESDEVYCDEILSPASRAKRKINPPKRYSPSKKFGNKAPTKLSPKLLRSRKSLTLPLSQSSPIRTKPRRSLNMKSQTPNLTNSKKTVSGALNINTSSLMEISEEKPAKHPDCTQETAESFETTGKRIAPLSSEPMDIDQSEVISSKQESYKESQPINTVSVIELENCAPVLEGKGFENSSDNIKKVDSSLLNSTPLETTESVNNTVQNTDSKSLKEKEEKPDEKDVLNCSVGSLNESRDFTLSLAVTPKPNGNISMQENSPEIFDSVNLNETSDVFKIYGANENKNSTEKNDETSDCKEKLKKNGSTLKMKNSRLLKNVLCNGMSPLKTNNITNSPSQKLGFVSLDSWITRSTKQSENGVKPVEFSQNSDIIESSQPDVPLSSFKQKILSASSPIMAQLNSSIYCSPKSAVETEPNSGSKPKVARKLILNEKDTLGIESSEKSRAGVINNENSYNETSKMMDSEETPRTGANFNHKLTENTKVLSPRNQYLGRTALMMNMAIGDDSKHQQTPSSKPVQKESVTPSPPRTPQHLNSVGKKWVKRRYISDAPPTPSILKKSRNDENEPRSKGKLVSFADPPMIEVLEFSASDPQKDKVYGLDVAGLTESTPDDYSTQGSIPEMPEVSRTKLCYAGLISCMDPIDGIFPLLVESKWHAALKEKFEAKNLKTVGCLASLSELQACQLPVGEPRLFRIKNVLKEYHRSLLEKRKEMEEERKYEKSNFMCKFLMPAGIDKAIKKDGENSRKEREKEKTIENCRGEENISNEKQASIHIDSGIDDICEDNTCENLEPKICADVIEVSQSKETNEDDSCDIICASSSVKEKPHSEGKQTDIPLNNQKILTTLFEVGASHNVCRREVNETESSAALNENVTGKKEIVTTVKETKIDEEESSVKLNKNTEQSTEAEKDEDIITISQSSEKDNHQSHCVHSTDVAVKKLSSKNLNEHEIRSSSGKDKVTFSSFEEMSTEPSLNKSIIEVDEKMVTEEVKKSTIMASNKSGETIDSSELPEVKLAELKPTNSSSQETKLESALKKSLHPIETVTASEVRSSLENNKINESSSVALPTEPTATTEIESKVQEKPLSVETSKSSQLKEEKTAASRKSLSSTDKANTEISANIITETPVSQLVKSNTRSLRKRKALGDCETPKNKVSKSAERKKLDQQQTKESDLIVEEKGSGSSEDESLCSSEVSEKPVDGKRSVTLTLENDTAFSTPYEIIIPLEHCETKTSTSKDTESECSGEVCISENSAVKKRQDKSKDLEYLITRDIDSKKEILRVLFRDEDPSSCLTLLQDTILNRVDVKRDLFNYLLNDKELGVKFCAKF